MEESSSSQTSTNRLTSEYSNNHQNGNHKYQESLQSNEQFAHISQNRLPSPGLLPIQTRKSHSIRFFLLISR